MTATGTLLKPTKPPVGTPAPSIFPPGDDERPCYVVLDEWQTEEGQRKYRPGVYYCAIQEQRDGPSIPTEDWICSPLYVDAVTHDEQENNFGRLLRFKTTLERWREWAMPMEMLRSYGDELRGALLAMGVNLEPNRARKLLPMYLQHRVPKRRMHCAMQTGWAKAGTFVLPDAVIGPNASDVTYQTIDRGHTEYTTAGTLDDWKAEIAHRAIGNPLLMLALSAGFAGPLLRLTHSESGGVHFTGDSSTGKSISVEAACSIWGGPQYKRSWNTTANGMEGAASLFNDGLLALDEIGECDAKDVGKIIYALGNGVGKQRANRNGGARSLTRWNCSILSSGEVTTETMVTEGGGRLKAGQAVRLVIVRAKRAYGAFDNLHDFPDGATFGNSIRRAAATHYGHAGRAFLARLTNDTTDWIARFEEIKSLPIFSQAAEGQAKRVAARFALYGMAGRLATEYGLTGWGEKDAFMVASECFQRWLSERGGGNDERRQILDQITAFIDQHGDSRFSDADAAPTDRSPTIRDRAGWWRDTDAGRTYLFHAQGMRAALQGRDFTPALNVLQEAGVLPEPKADGKRSHLVRVEGRPTPKRLYHITIDRKGGGHES